MAQPKQATKRQALYAAEDALTTARKTFLEAQHVWALHHGLLVQSDPLLADYAQARDAGRAAYLLALDTWQMLQEPVPGVEEPADDNPGQEE